VEDQSLLLKGQNKNEEISKQPETKKTESRFVLGSNEQKVKSIDYMTTEDLVTLHKKALNEHDKIEKNRKLKNNMRINHDESKRILTYSDFAISSKGI